MTEATAKKATPRKAPARKADPFAAVLAEMGHAARQVGALPSTLVGGNLPERGTETYRRRAVEWDLINNTRRAGDVLGVDGLAVQVAFAAFGGRTVEEIRDGLVHLASLAVAAIGQIDRETK
ncbi:hypothetical protein OG824_18545 [Streptomyces prunicolor]|uniref:hypothetical protein n=1 Tax=Streptomyces prunicolor TaxID=67348 RepID=UPI002252CF77|nr:hypothetical protein [Streptomyces prunicolor]MCX5237201.1 hypothetical protein [Streptomyces prunicolor]